MSWPATGYSPPMDDGDGATEAVALADTELAAGADLAAGVPFEASVAGVGDVDGPPHAPTTRAAPATAAASVRFTAARLRLLQQPRVQRCTSRHGRRRRRTCRTR